MAHNYCSLTVENISNFFFKFPMINIFFPFDKFMMKLENFYLCYPILPAKIVTFIQRTILHIIMIFGSHVRQNYLGSFSTLFLFDIPCFTISMQQLLVKGKIICSV